MIDNEIIKDVYFVPTSISPKGLIGFSGFLFRDSLSLNNIGVYLRADGGIRLVFPDKLLPNGKQIQLFYPVNSATYEAMRSAVAQKVKELVSRANERKE